MRHSDLYRFPRRTHSKLARPAGAALIIALLASALAFGATTAQAAPPYPDADWPQANAPWTIEIIKDPDAVPPPHEPSDLSWLHLHRNHPTLPDAGVNTIQPQLIRGYQTMDLTSPAIEMQYVVRGIPVSGWLSAPFTFDLEITNDGLGQLQDGVHDLTVVVRGADRFDFKPLPAFIHLSRDRNDGDPFGYDTSVPIMNIVQGNPTDYWSFGPGITYVDPSERNVVGYPVNPNATPWTAPPLEADLYQELMAPHTELFGATQMWWDHPGENGHPFVRGMTPQHGEDHRELRVGKSHERFPMKDGPSGVGWMSPYVSGSIDSQGRFAFAEAGGRVGYLMPDGEIITLAGWRVQPGLDPLWWEKPTDIVRQNMEVRGNWMDGRGEFFTPLDVAIDPLDENILYVAAYEDHVIWKIDVPDDPRGQEATVSILAGDPSHTAGYADGSGDTARFDGVSSLVFDPVADALFVADQDNDAIRRVERDGTVTTVAGQPGMRARLTGAGGNWTDQLASRAATQFEVSATQAANGVTPDIYMPQSIRVDSQGNIILLELGYGAIRKINPATGETETLDEVRQKLGEYDRGWAWFDVDRWGNSGPVDGIYWTKFVNTIEGEHFSEVYRWLSPDGGPSVNLFPSPTGLYPDGWGRLSHTNAPHYGWLVAVDPRGGVLLAGGGEHGVTRLRPQRAEDPVETSNYWLGRQIWETGVPVDAPVASQSLALKFGWGGHNYLGLTDAWSLFGASDAELLDAFEVPDVIRDDATAIEHLLEFIRPNTYRSEGDPITPPPPTPTPTPVPPTPTPTPVPPTPTPVPPVGDVPADGEYNLRNVASGKYLQSEGSSCCADAEVATSSELSSENVLKLTNIAGDVFTIAFTGINGFLDADRPNSVGLSRVPRDDDHWQLIPVTNSNYYMRNLTTGRFLSQDGNEIRLSRDQTANETWSLRADLVNEYVGSSIALQNQNTSKWLDTDPTGGVDQSTRQRADDVWKVLDASDGYMYLQNTVTRRFLDADAPNGDVDTSAVPRSDDRWSLELLPPDIGRAETGFVVRNVDHGGYLTALPAVDQYNVVTDMALTDAALWDLVVIDAAG